MNLAQILMTAVTVVNGQFDIISTSKYRGQVIKFFDRLSNTSPKQSQELQKVENWTTVACTELIEATR